ncbi:hypothetical protein [Nostoc sp. 'Peltigera membranacea cyanobiont' N6]|uniref:hypothetical protein n=1 Tax=Nostoc sp. 'Peltigera membranacea cyanobiont' N6 TaxID=1261031 RepID=UPI0011AFDEC1|nr:hypothetical protein [Nostoc sp. 'Peltigera membranacea cyanobiont' N6]
MYYYDDNANLQFEKSLKILQIGEYSTNTPQIFDSLDKDFVSIGQDMEYYTNLKKLGESVYSGSQLSEVQEPHPQPPPRKR